MFTLGKFSLNLAVSHFVEALLEYTLLYLFNLRVIVSRRGVLLGFKQVKSEQSLSRLDVTRGLAVIDSR